MRLKPLALLLIPTVAMAVGCAPKKDSATGTSGKASASACQPDKLELKSKDKLTIATDSPAFEPWFADNDPSNGKGYESVVAYAIAKELGFDKNKVTWVKQQFNSSYAPGKKKFDFDINQISISPERAKVVDFSKGYYSAAQAVITMKANQGKAGSLADLKELKVGAQTGSTSLTAVRQQIKPTQQPAVFRTTNDASQALRNGQVQAIVADLPSAFYITGAMVKGSTVAGQFQPTVGEQEEFGLLMEKGSKLKPCLDRAVTTLKDNGTLAKLEKQWLSATVNVPELK